MTNPRTETLFDRPQKPPDPDAWIKPARVGLLASSVFFILISLGSGSILTGLFALILFTFACDGILQTVHAKLQDFTQRR